MIRNKRILIFLYNHNQCEIIEGILNSRKRFFHAYEYCLTISLFLFRTDGDTMESVQAIELTANVVYLLGCLCISLKLHVLKEHKVLYLSIGISTILGGKIDGILSHDTLFFLRIYCSLRST